MQTEDGSLSRILDVHLYITAAKSDDDLRGLSLQIALETMQNNAPRDSIKALKTNIRHGRPDWDDVRVYNEYIVILTLLTVFCHLDSLSGVDRRFRHDRPAFSASGNP